MAFKYIQGCAPIQQVYFSGNLYNDSQLKHDLGIDGDQSVETLVLAAYRRWGRECPDKFDGEFFFALWDEAHDEVFCARDIFGIVPAYYYWNEHEFFASTTISEVVSFIDGKITPDLGFIAEYLSQHLCSVQDTIYSQIKRLPAHHCLNIRGTSLTQSSHFTPAIPSQFPNKTESEFVMELRQLLAASIKKRLLETEKTGVYLSGGVDSSCILAAMNELVNSPINTYSMLFEGHNCDESRYINSVTNSFNCVPHSIQSASLPTGSISDRIRDCADLPVFPNNMISDPIRQLVRDSGCKKVLTGFGGDEFFTGGSFTYIQLFHQYNLRKTLSQLKSDPRFYSIASRICPTPVKKLLRNCGLSQTWIPNYLTENFVAQSNLPIRLQNKTSYNFTSSLEKQNIIRTTFSAIQQLTLEQDYRSAQENSILHSHPFLDRSLLEYSLRIPETLLMRDDVSKYILRTAYQKTLPASVLRRDDKADFSFIYKDLFDEIGGRSFFSDLGLYDANILKKDKVLDVYDIMTQECDTDTFIEGSSKLWSIAAIELVWRELF